MFEAPSCYHDYKFSKSKSAKGDNSKKIKEKVVFFFELSPFADLDFENL